MNTENLTPDERVDALELAQLRRIDQAARAFVDAVASESKGEQARRFNALCEALFNGVGEPNERA